MARRDGVAVLHPVARYGPYCLAEVDLAPPLMDRYVVALPGQPNPQDSYAEILRMSGNFQGALEHYRAALKISPRTIRRDWDFAKAWLLQELNRENRRA